MYRRALVSTGVVGGLVVSLLSAAPALAAEPIEITHRASATETFADERVYLDGHVTRGGEGVAGETVVAQERPAGTLDWTTIRTITTSSSGHYTYTDRPDEPTEYRVVVRESSKVDRTVGPRVDVSPTSKGDRKLYEREDAIARFMGDPVGGREKDGIFISQEYEKGVIIKVNRRSSLGDRVWAITGRMYAAWERLGGLDSKLAHPVTDVQCDLIEDGCIQRFAGGSLYYSDDADMTVQYGRGAWTDVGAVAKSQVGYKEPAWRDSKYNEWIGDDNAWCGVFQGWIFAASGNGDLVPAEARFSNFVTSVQRDMKIVQNPRPGDIALLDFTHIGNPSTPTHAVFIKRVDGNSLITYEGNTTSGTGDLTRGVWHRKRSANLVVVYVRPDW